MVQIANLSPHHQPVCKETSHRIVLSVASLDFMVVTIRNLARQSMLRHCIYLAAHRSLIGASNKEGRLAGSDELEVGLNKTSKYPTQSTQSQVLKSV